MADSVDGCTPKSYEDRNCHRTRANKSVGEKAHSYMARPILLYNNYKPGLNNFNDGLWPLGQHQNSLLAEKTKYSLGMGCDNISFSSLDSFADVIVPMPQLK